MRKGRKKKRKVIFPLFQFSVPFYSKVLFHPYPLCLVKVLQSSFSAMAAGRVLFGGWASWRRRWSFDDLDLWTWSPAELNYLCPFPRILQWWLGERLLPLSCGSLSLGGLTYSWFSPCSGSKCSSRTADQVADCHLHVSLSGALAELTAAWLTLRWRWWTLDRSADCRVVRSWIEIEEDVTLAIVD